MSDLMTREAQLAAWGMSESSSGTGVIRPDFRTEVTGSRRGHRRVVTSGYSLPSSGSALEPGGDGGNDAAMTAVTREEHDAKLQALEYKIDGRIGRLEALLESAVSGIGRIEASFGRETGKLEQRMDDNRKHTTNVGWAIFGGVVAVIALAATVYQTGLTGRQVIGAQPVPTHQAAPASAAQPPPR